MFKTIEDYQIIAKNKRRWESVGAFSEEEYKENVKRNNALQAYIAHLRSENSVQPNYKSKCNCVKGSYGCKLCNPGAYAGEGYYSNNPEETS